MRKLVITADDLGREPSATGAILDLLAKECVTATTLIPVSPHSAYAAERAVAAGVEAHLHVTLTSERGLEPWRPLTPAASLVDADGFMHTDPTALGTRGETAHVVAEMEAQHEWLLERGFRPRALDSHAGTLYGLHGTSWLAEALQFCAAHGLAFRLPRDPALYWGSDLGPLREPHARAVAFADSLGVPLPAAIITNRLSADEHGTYEGLRDHMLRMLGQLPEGTSELFLHPADDGEPTRVWERDLLRDDAFHRALEAEGIQLTDHWRDA